MYLLLIYGFATKIDKIGFSSTFFMFIFLQAGGGKWKQNLKLFLLVELRFSRILKEVNGLVAHGNFRILFVVSFTIINLLAFQLSKRMKHHLHICAIQNPEGLLKKV